MVSNADNSSYTPKIQLKSSHSKILQNATQRYTYSMYKLNCINIGEKQSSFVVVAAICLNKLELKLSSNCITVRLERS